MKVAIRTDASLQIGTGHVMRCLTLADQLRKEGGEIIFICREHEGNLTDSIKQRGFQCYVLPGVNSIFEVNDSSLFHASWLGVTAKQDAEECLPIMQTFQPDWLIVDHYAIDQTWEKMLRCYFKKLMIIDDLGDRAHICDLLLDQNYGSSKEKYRKLVPLQCQVLTGSFYALLRPEFSQLRGVSLQRRQKNLALKKILVTLGGVDPDNYTGQILEQLALSNLSNEIEVTVVMGGTAPHLKSVYKQSQLTPLKITIKTNVSNMAELMVNADLAIGAAGSTTWERCCLGLPSILIVVADNQRLIAEALNRANAIQLLTEIRDLPHLLSTNAQWFFSTTQKCQDLTDGRGVGRVIDHMERINEDRNFNVS